MESRKEGPQIKVERNQQLCCGLSSRTQVEQRLFCSKAGFDKIGFIPYDLICIGGRILLLFLASIFRSGVMYYMA